jgi:CSLREA domain-containing protein
MTLLLAAAAAAAVLLAFALTAIHPAAASAATTVMVNTTLDETQAGNGTCSLREATLYANGTAEPDCAPLPPSGTTTISVPPGTYTLTAGPLTLTGSASISGAGATITAGGKSQVLLVMQAATVSVSGLTVTGGQSPSACTGPLCVGARLPSFGFPGGGIANDGTLMLTGVTVSGNHTGAGAVNGACLPPNVPPGPCDGGSGGDGGGISNSKTGTLTIVSSTIVGNSTGSGAAGQPGPPNDVPGNSGPAGNGGGISNAGTLTIKNSTIADNTTAAGPDGAPGGVFANSRGGNASLGGAGGSGGGIENSGPLFISGTTFVGNRTGAGGNGGTGGAGTSGGNGSQGGAGGSGGAIDSSADMTITNATVVANAAAGGGAAGRNGAPSTPPDPGPGQPGTGGGLNQRAMGSTLAHVTFTANSASGVGGGVDGAGGTVTVGNSIIAGNVAATPNLNCAGVLVDQGGNIEFAASSCPAGFLKADPKLTGLAQNGGPTQTIALQPGSAAIQHVRTCVLNTDQRGVGRPVGAACDSGAYQVAPPSVTGIAASAITTTSATVGASVNANLQDTTVVVNFGRTASYGSSTPPRDLGAGNAPVPFTAALAGLAPNTTYHFDVVATNADGRTTSSDGVFTTLPPLTASIARASTTGPALALTIACAGGSGPGTCAGIIRLSATDPAKHRRDKLTVATGRYSVASGGRVTVTLRLNRKGQTMLSQHYTLVSTVSLAGTTPVTRKVTFSYPLIKSPISYTWAFGATSSTASELTVNRVPRRGKVRVICHGNGCPFAQRTFAPRRGRVVLAPVFQHNPLQPGAILVLEVIAANRVAKVETFTIRGGLPPTVVRECLAPGTSTPTRCV